MLASELQALEALRNWPSDASGEVIVDDLGGLHGIPDHPEDILDTAVKELVTAARRVLEDVRRGSRISPKMQSQARATFDALGMALRDNDAPALSTITVATDGTWFEIDGNHVDVARRGAVRRILAALADARVKSAGKPLTVDALFQIGWPGEHIPYESQVRRVYTAVWTLRTLGLEHALVTRDDGYTIDPKRAVAVKS